jgi:hypothetical protein
MFTFCLLIFWLSIWIGITFKFDSFGTGFFVSVILTTAAFAPQGSIKSEEYKKTENITVYSISTPTNENSFSFGIFNEVNGSKSYVSYLVRTKVSNGYKDIILKDIVLSESSDLVGVGKFVSIESCVDSKGIASFFFFWTYEFDKTWKDCTLQSKVLSLPVGSVRKNISSI